MKLLNKIHTLEKGFTLIEMLVVAPIVILTIGAFLTVIINMTGEVLASRASNNLSYNVQDALNHIDQDVKMSTGFLATDNIPDALFSPGQGASADSAHPTDATHFANVGGVNGTSLILNMVATDTNPISTGNSYVYLKNQPNACATPQSNTVGNKPFTYTIVYFVKDNNLYRRIVMPTNYNSASVVCVTPWQQPSCLPGILELASPPTYCKTKDVELVDGIATNGFNVQYFNGQATTTVNTPASTAPLATDRATALQSATTVGVSIYAQQSTAGRIVERTAILRTSRLDGNASGIASVLADGPPAAPSVSGSISEPTNAVFTWGRVPLATGYTIQYRINGGSWQTGFTNQNTLTYTVTSSNPKDVVDAQVVAINGNISPSQSSSAGTASVTAPLWISPGLLNNWSNYNGGTYANAAYTKTPDGLVIIKGLIGRTGTFVSGEDLFVLPPGYRPEKQQTFQVESNNVGASVSIATNGEVIATTAISGAWVSLSNLTFMSATAPHTFAPLSLVNNWVNRQLNADDPLLSYTKDAVGRYIIRGTIAGGTVTNGTPVTSALPPDAAVAKQAILPVRSGSGGDNTVGIGYTAQSLTAKGTAVGSAYFLNFMYFPDSYTGTWNTFALQNSWVTYSTLFNTPAYTKSSDNIVTLRGLMKSGTTTSGTLLATLPAGYRPSSRLVFASACNDANCRIDINENGSIFVMAGGDSWLTIDKISFYADK